MDHTPNRLNELAQAKSAQNGDEIGRIISQVAAHPKDENTTSLLAVHTILIQLVGYSARRVTLGYLCILVSLLILPALFALVATGVIAWWIVFWHSRYKKARILQRLVDRELATRIPRTSG